MALQMSVLSVRERVQMLPKTVISRASNTYTKKSKRLGTIGAYTTLTRTTKPNVYNTSSATTAHYHAVGDTNMEYYTRNKSRRRHHHHHHHHRR